MLKLYYCNFKIFIYYFILFYLFFWLRQVLVAAQGVFIEARGIFIVAPRVLSSCGVWVFSLWLWRTSSRARGLCSLRHVSYQLAYSLLSFILIIRYSPYLFIYLKVRKFCA